MTGVLQNGTVTPGHLVSWVTQNVIGDAGAPAIANQSIIASLRGANFNTTADQPIPIPAGVAAFQLTGIIVTNASTNLFNAVGGFYPQASKGGTPIVSAAQTYSLLTTANILLLAGLSAYGTGTRFSAANLGTVAGQFAIWFALSTPQGGLAAADIYLLGNNLT